MLNPSRPHWADAPICMALVSCAVIGLCYAVAAFIRGLVWIIQHVAIT